MFLGNSDSNNNSNNTNAEFGILDALNILSFCMQAQNIDNDEEHNAFIRELFKSIDNEIKKLHEENDIIIAQNEVIIKLLEKEE